VREIDKMMRILKEHKEELERDFSVKKIGIFGSYTREEETPESDVDIYVEFDIKNLTFDRYLELIDYLEKLLGRKIDLITKYGVETIRIPYIKKEIRRSLIYA